MSFFKKIASDLDDLTAAQLLLKYIVPFIAALMTFAAFGNYYASSLTLDKLSKETGIVKEIEIQKVSGVKYNRHPLNILLNNNKKFTLRVNYKEDFGSIIRSISIGDEITIYHRDSTQTIKTIGTTDEIMQIDKAGQTIFSLNLIKENTKMNYIFMFIVSAALWLIYYFLHLRKRRPKIS